MHSFLPVGKLLAVEWEYPAMELVASTVLTAMTERSVRIQYYHLDKSHKGTLDPLPTKRSLLASQSSICTLQRQDDQMWRLLSLESLFVLFCWNQDYAGGPH